jgi:hypothetical protein
MLNFYNSMATQLEQSQCGSLGKRGVIDVLAEFNHFHRPMSRRVRGLWGGEPCTQVRL